MIRSPLRKHDYSLGSTLCPHCGTDHGLVTTGAIFRKAARLARATELLNEKGFGMNTLHKDTPDAMNKAWMGKTPYDPGTADMARRGRLSNGDDPKAFPMRARVEAEAAAARVRNEAIDRANKSAADRMSASDAARAEAARPALRPAQLAAQGTIDRAPLRPMIHLSDEQVQELAARSDRLPLGHSPSTESYRQVEETREARREVLARATLKPIDLQSFLTAK